MPSLSDLNHSQTAKPSLGGAQPQYTTTVPQSGKSGTWDDTRPHIKVSPRATRRAVTHSRVLPSTQNRWGWLPTLSLTGALGLLVVAAANRLSGSGVQGMEPFFWLGLGMIVLPIAARLLAKKVARPERLGLVLVLGIDLYLIKVMQSPFGFTYSDEFIHLFNASKILETGHLFAENPVLRVSALYPGVEAATVGLVQLTGLDIFNTGLMVVGLARAVLMLSLFLLYEQISGSARTASIATLLYTGHSNFMFWSAQFSYESLALPLVVLTLYLIARRESDSHIKERLGLTIAALLLIGAIVVTHHLSSYFLASTLVIWALIIPVSLWIAKGSGDRSVQSISTFLRARVGAATGGPGGLALFAIVAAISWLVFVASLTLGYLSPMFGKAVVSLLSQISGDEVGRGLFHSTSGSVAPLWERVVGITAVLLCLLGLPFGLWQAWRRSRYHPLGVLMITASIAYFGLLVLRFVPSAWEISNRSSEFLFLGLAFVLASGHLPRRIHQSLLVGAIGIIIAGGIVAGWSSDLRVAQVYQVVTDDLRLEPPGLTTARWVRTFLGTRRNFAADDTNGRYLLAYADQNGLTGRNLDIKSIYESAELEDWQIQLLRTMRIQYVAVDRRLDSGNNMLGYFFTQANAWPLPSDQMLPSENYAKFDKLPHVSRFYDSGDLVLYDIRRWIDELPQP